MARVLSLVAFCVAALLVFCAPAACAQPIIRGGILGAATPSAATGGCVPAPPHAHAQRSHAALPRAGRGAPLRALPLTCAHNLLAPLR
jgi:hypothetical protein